MSDLDQTILVFFIVYVLAVIGISLYRSNQAQDMADHVLAGRRVGTITTGLSASSSLDRGWALIFVPAIAVGLHSLAVAGAVAFVLGLWGSWKLIAPRLRRFTFAAQNSLTIPEFLERRFLDRTGTLRVLAAALTLLFVIFYVSAGIMAGGIIFNLAFGVSAAVGGLLTILTVLAYIFIGGYAVVARTDVLQSMVTLFGLAILAVAVFVVTSNPTEVNAEALDSASDTISESTNVFFSLVLFALFLLANVQGAFGAQRLLQRFMAAKSEAIMDTSRRISTTWLIFIFASSILLGLFAQNAVAQEGFQLTLGRGTASEEGIQFFFWLADLIASPFVGALALTAIVAAVMSTMDSQMLIGASVATADLPFVRRYAQRKRFEYVLGAYMRVWVGRLMLILIALIAWLLAISQPNSVLVFLTYAWLGTGGTFGPVVFLSLYWRRFNIYGAMAALIAGGLTTLAWAILDIGFILFGAAMLGVLPIAVLVTLVTKAPSAEVQEMFEQSLVKTESA